MASVRERPSCRWSRVSGSDLCSEGDKLDEQELNDVFNDSELSNNIISTPTQSTTTNRKIILSKFDSQDLIVNCSSSTCGRRLLLSRRKCYLCDHTFCLDCTSHSRELGGTLRHTCATCFADLHVRQQPGHQRDLKGLFSLRRRVLPPAPYNGYGLNRPLSRSRQYGIQVERELQRLCCGYADSTSTRLRSSISDLVGAAKMPRWQQGALWQPGHEVAGCNTCRKEFSLLSSRQHCRVCGRVFCPECVAQVLMLYKSSAGDSSAQWALNGVEGIPSAEPPVFQLFRICPSCQSQIEQLLLQARTSEERDHQLDTSENFLDSLRELYRSLLKHKLFVLDSLPSFVHRVEVLSRGSSDGALARELSRLQTDLSDHFSLLAVELQRFQFLDPTSSRQQTLLSNVSKAFLAFYHTNMPTFRMVTRQLHEIFSPDVMQIILEHNNYTTLNIVYLLIRQLCLELTYIVSKFQTSERLFEKLVELDDVIISELEMVVTKRGEEWESHKSAVSKHVKEQFSEKPMVYTGKHRSFYSEELVHKRVQEKLLLCLRTLEARTNEKSFQATKSALRSLQRKRGLLRGITV